LTGGVGGGILPTLGEGIGSGLLLVLFLMVTEPRDDVRESLFFLFFLTIGSP